jgi:acyl-coenzyme A thioesterase PaaI-like protein
VTRLALTNEQWSIDTNCFVCEPTNAHGLKLPFFAENDTVVADFLLDDRYSGAPNFVHGGVLLAILDEAMAWAIIALGGKFALTASTSADFDGPVFVGHEYSVVAWLTEQGDTTMCAAAEIRYKSKPVVRASASFVVVSEVQALEAGASSADREMFRTEVSEAASAVHEQDRR